MSIFSKIYKVLNSPPKVTLNKAKDKITSNYKIRRDKASDMEKTGYQNAPVWFMDIANNFFNLTELKLNAAEIDSFRRKSGTLLNHEFNLLGSGPVIVRHGLEPSGLEGIIYPPDSKEFHVEEWLNENLPIPNREKSFEIISLIEKHYELMDWQIDFKSGYRWRELEWYRDIRWGHMAGADIKIPWELGRMQHLVQLAICCKLASNNQGFLKPEIYFAEFRNQILDFIGSNPPRFGVQWMNAMEVGIRAVNWLAAYDLFNSLGYKFEGLHLRYFIDLIYEHLVHILSNLEWSSGMRGNHYLANIMAVLVISAYMPVSSESSKYLAFVIQELISEVMYQFNSDGSNFEASTSYHGFSLEMVLVAYTIIKQLNPEQIYGLKDFSNDNWNFTRRLKKVDEQQFKVNQGIIFPDEFCDRLKSAFTFSCNLMSSSYIGPAIGDDDSGFILKFINESMCDKQYHNSNKHLINSFGFLFGLSGDNSTSSLSSFLNKPVTGNKELICENPTNFNDVVLQFPDGGYYIFENDLYKVVIRCGPIGQKGKGGHSHNDQLSFNMDVKSLPIFVDPGTYVYSALPEKRNLFRSTQMHNTLWIDGVEQNKWLSDSKDDLFWYIGDRTMSKPIKIEDRLFIGEHYAYNEPHTRTFSFRKDYLDIFDNCEDSRVKNLSFHLNPDIIDVFQNSEKEVNITYKGVSLRLFINNSKLTISEYLFSPAYGELLTAKKIIAHEISAETHCKIIIESY